MRAVTIADLKNNLSSYLRAVLAGEEVVILNRRRPMAKIVPLRGIDDIEAEEEALVASGHLRPGEGPLPASFWSMPAPRLSLARILRAFADERTEG